MKPLSLIFLSCLLCPFTAAFGQQIYCPQNSSYINIGMTQDEVIAACGQPLSKQQANTPATVRIPVKQFIYTALNKGSVYPGLNSAFYEQWSLPSGTLGTSVEINVMNDKVSSVKINGSNTNAISICQGTNFEVGDNVSKVYRACGSPDMINDTFINQPIPSNSLPEVWTYQMNQYQSPINLTFVNGKLQSAN